MIELSISEFRALVAKAFRGVGYSWGLTEDAAFASVLLARSGLPAADLTLQLLTAVDGLAFENLVPDADWATRGTLLCPICLGTTLTDQAGCTELVVASVATPAFAAALLASSADDGAGGYSLQCDQAEWLAAGSGVSFTGSDPTTPVDIRITWNNNISPPPAHRDRVHLTASALQSLEAFAHRIYAPATEASRKSAGAGTTDND